MSDRRRRRLDDEGEDETTESNATETNSSRKDRPRVSECESEGESGDVELSEYDSESIGDGGEHEETEEGTESETEEGSETEDVTDSGTETEGAEDYTDEEGVDGERQSGDGEEQPDTDKPDDDEDRKNPAYVPRKGAFYEHDFRDGLEGEEEEAEVKEQPAKTKKKLWQEDDKWAHDFYRDDLQAPKSREELIAVYGYDIRAASKPPEVLPRQLRQRGGGPRREKRFKDYLPRMAVIDTTEYGKDTVPNIDKDGLITYKDDAPRNNSRPFRGNKRGGAGGRGGRIKSRNNREEDFGEEKNYKQFQYNNERVNHPSNGNAYQQDEYPSLQEAAQSRLDQEEGGRTVRKVIQTDNRYRDSNQQYNHRQRDSYQQDNRYHRDNNQYSNDERLNNSGHGDNRRGGYRGGHRGQGSSNYRRQDLRQQDSRANEDNWNQRDRYDGSRKDGNYNNNRGDEIRKVIITDDYQASPRMQGGREDGSKNFKSQDSRYNNNNSNKQSPYQGGDNNGPRRSVHDDYNNSKRSGYKGYEQPPRYQQQQQQQNPSNRETREFTNTSYRGEERGGSRKAPDAGANSYTLRGGPGEGNDVNSGKESQSTGTNVEKKSYAKERRAKGTQRIGDPGVKDRPSSMSGPVDSTGTGQGHQYINTTPTLSTETASAPSATGAKRYSSQRQQGMSKGGNYTEPISAERGANLYNPAMPPPSFYQHDPATSGQQPTSSSPAGVPDAPHFNPAILPPGTTALPYHLPAVPQPGLQMTGTSRPPVFRPAQGLPPPPPPSAPLAQAAPALIAPPYIPPGMIYGAPAAPPRVPPPGTPAGLSLPFAYTAPPPPNPLTATAPPAVSQADQMAMSSAQQGQQPAGQPKKVYRSDIIYYAPELQHPSRTPQKRPKSAIPIVDPEEMRRLKLKDSPDDRNVENKESMKRPSTSLNSPIATAPDDDIPSSSVLVNNASSKENPKPQRLHHDRPRREHISESAEKTKDQQEDANGSIQQQQQQQPQPHSRDTRNANQKEDSNLKTSAKAETPNNEANHVDSSSFPVAVKSIKNDVLDVSSIEASVSEKTVVNASKPEASIESSSSPTKEANVGKVETGNSGSEAVSVPSEAAA